MNQRHPQPSSNTGRRQHQGQGKPARPGLHRRVQSYHNAHTQAASVSRTTTAAAKKAAREESSPTEDYDDMAGLPQFCTTCERQIVNPGNSTLYCSRACQRRDSAKPSPLDPLASPAWTPTPTTISHHPPDPNYPDILPQRSPTVLRPLSLTFSDLHLASSNPTSPTSPASSSDDHDHDDDATLAWPPAQSQRRPHVTRASTSTLPSLSHTPSSSVGTTISSHSYSHRPRYNPTLSGHRTLKSADLVIPIPTFPGAGSVEGGRDASVKSGASTLTSLQVGEAGAPERPGRSGEAKGSLRQLFEHEAMMAKGRWR